MDDTHTIGRSEYKRMSRLFHVITTLMLLAQAPANAEGIEALWTQYGVSDGVLKMSLHTDLNPLKPVSARAELWLERKDAWTKISESEVEALTAMALFRIEDWNSRESTHYLAVCGSSRIEGIIRAEPKDKTILNFNVNGVPSTPSTTGVAVIV